MPRRMRYRKSAYRRRGSRIGKGLTGGTGDVNPQWMNLNSITNQTGAGGTAHVSTASPIPFNQMPIKGGSSLVMEILKVEFTRTYNTAAGSAGSGLQTLSTKNTTTVADLLPISAHVIASAPFAACVQAATNSQAPLVQRTQVDLTDQTGHGVLCASQNLYQQASFVAGDTAATSVFSCRILYRWKYVPIMEYIGIVTSQLNS